MGLGIPENVRLTSFDLSLLKLVGPSRNSASGPGKACN